MHRIDALGHVGNMFDPGDPLAPRNPTKLDHDWLNAVQEELANFISAAGISLAKGTNNQLEKALPIRAHGRVEFNPTPGGAMFIIPGARNIASASIISGVPNRVRVNFITPIPGDNYTVVLTENMIGGFTTPLFASSQSHAVGSFDFIICNPGFGIIDPATISSRQFGIMVCRY